MRGAFAHRLHAAERRPAPRSHRHAKRCSSTREIRRRRSNACAALLEEAGLEQHLDTVVGELSGGLRQRLGFALALLPDPGDPGSRRAERESRRREPAMAVRAAGRLAGEGRTVIVSTHAGQELLAAGHRRIGLEAGRVVDASRGATDASTSIVPDALSGAAARGGARVNRVSPIAGKEMRDAVEQPMADRYATCWARSAWRPPRPGSTAHRVLRSRRSAAPRRR